MWKNFHGKKVLAFPSHKNMSNTHKFLDKAMYVYATRVDLELLVWELHDDLNIPTSPVPCWIRKC